MKRSKFTDEQILAIVKEGEAGPEGRRPVPHARHYRADVTNALEEQHMAAKLDPVNVNGGVFFNQNAPQAHAIYTVPAGKLLIIEDASASASDSVTASIPGRGVMKGVSVNMSLRTNPTGTIPMGSADHVIVNKVGLPAGGGRAMKAYAAPGTQVLFLLGGATVAVNTTVYFSGQLVDFP